MRRSGLTVVRAVGTLSTMREESPNDALLDGPAAWWRLGVILALSTVGGIGLWSVVVVLPAWQAEFGVDRAGAALPYTATTLGLMLGGVFLGRLADRTGAMVPALIAAVALGAGYLWIAQAETLTEIVIVQGLLVGMLGSAGVFSPLVADASLWFVRRRGLAVSIAASGNYLAGAIWPPVVEALVAEHGWRSAHQTIGVICLATMLPLALLLRRRAPMQPPMMVRGGRQAGGNGLQLLLMVAAVSCCVAMAMPQVHIVAYCADLGYGAARGAEMLALMLGMGVVSRLGFGLIADRIGGVRTLILGSALQAAALALFLPFDGLASLYVISALFGLFQGGIVPSYALIVRERFPAAEAGTRVSLVLSSTLAGMALGGWLTGLVFDATGTYAAAIVNGLLWNALNLGIAAWLLGRDRGARPAALAPA